MLPTLGSTIPPAAVLTTDDAFEEAFFEDACEDIAREDTAACAADALRETAAEEDAGLEGVALEETAALEKAAFEGAACACEDGAAGLGGSVLDGTGACEVTVCEGAAGSETAPDSAKAGRTAQQKTAAAQSSTAAARDVCFRFILRQVTVNPPAPLGK